MPNFSTIQQPLSEKTSGRGGKKFVWREEMESAFWALKEKIKQDVCLANPEYGPDAAPLLLYMDASGVGAGACLVQQQRRGQGHSLCFHNLLQSRNSLLYHREGAGSALLGHSNFPAILPWDAFPTFY